MHPDIARELMTQRTREMREAAQEASLARKLRHALRARSRDRRPFEPPVIPDYVDDMVASPAGHVPAQRNDSPANSR